MARLAMGKPTSHLHQSLQANRPPPITTTSGTSRHQDPPTPPPPPLPLHPLQPLPQARRVRRLAPTTSSPGDTSAPRRLRLLERLPAPSSSSSSTSSSFSPTLSSKVSYYVIEETISIHPTTGVTVLLATPLMHQPQAHPRPPPPAAPSRSHHGPVVIKAAPRTPRPPQPTVGDDPLREVAAHQLLLQHSSSSSSSSSKGSARPLPSYAYSPHVICLLDFLQDDDYIYIVLPYLSGGDLFARVESTKGQGLSEAEAASYLRQVAQGLLFLKEAGGLAHHDVSLENVMLTSHQQDEAQIIDLGMCLRVPHHHRQQSHMVAPQRCSGKPAYVAPEVVQERAFDPFAADVWSLGVCLYMMLMARPLYTSPHDQAFKILSRPGGAREVLAAYETYGLCLSPMAKDLVCSMLHASPGMRPTVEEVLRHPFVQPESSSGSVAVLRQRGSR